jgi:hypothetical protein
MCALVLVIRFSALGVKENSIETAYGNVVNFKANWLHADFKAQVNLTDFIYINARPKFMLNVSENDEGDYYDTDVMGVGGLGFKVTDNFSIDARYCYGFTNVFEGQLATEGFEAENRFYQLTLSNRM